MSISTQDVYDLLVDKYNAANRTASFERAFQYALERTLIDLATSRVGIAIVLPENLETDLDCDDFYFGVIMDGLMKYIEESGSWGQDENDSTLDANYERSLRRAHTYYCGTQTILTRGG